MHQLFRPSKGLVFLFCSVFALCCANTAWASTDQSSEQLIEYLAQEKIDLTLANHQIKLNPEFPHDQKNLIQQKKQNKSLLTLVQAKIVSLENFLVNQHKQQHNLSVQLKKLQQSPLGESDGVIAQEEVSRIHLLTEVNNKAIELITDNIHLAQNYEQALIAESRTLDIWQAKFDEQKHLDELRERIRILEDARSNLYQQNVALQKKKSPNAQFNTSFNHEAKILLNNQAIILIQYRITELEQQKWLIKAEYSLIRNQDIKTIQSIIDTYKTAIDQLSTIERSLKKMIVLLKNEQLLVTDMDLKQRFIHIQKTATLRLAQITAQGHAIQVDLEKKQQQLKQQLSVRQGLTEYHLNSWPTILHELLIIPAKCYSYFKSLSLKIRDNFIWLDFWPATFFWISILFIIGVTGLLRWAFGRFTMEKERSRLSGHLYDGLLVLLYRNIPLFTLLALSLVTFFLNHIPYIHYQLVLNLLIVAITFRSLIIIARLMLLENIEESSGHDATLYYRLKWLLLIGGWTTALMVLSHQLPLSLLLQDIFNRLFMLFMLAVSWVAWKSKDVVPYLLRNVLKTKKRYFRNAISLLTILVPLILLTTAIIGLIGYINLAWILSRYQAYLLLLLTSYVLIRGLMFDALELVSEWMIASLNNGWLWIEVILKPLDKILRVTLLLVSLLILFELFGWSSDAIIMESLQNFGHYPLVDVSGVHITLISTLKFILLVCILVWASKWTREFCYRWLYRNASDAGIRNSISVFTQYAVILIGSFITLRTLGLDFSGMSMVLGGLAVGMGFGLRDFASNIVGGMMLLIERPVREGDLITLGEYEGRVAHIGIRSMRVSSWDNMEVLIPNAETFNKPFTNWTHQDSVVRSVVPIKVSREDDPSLVQQLIFNVLIAIPEILSDPTPQVYLKQIDDALIEFEIRYFINVHLYTRFEIRSKVLFAIMDQFKAAGIKPPIPPYSVELQGAMVENVDETRRTTD